MAINIGINLDIVIKLYHLFNKNLFEFLHTYIKVKVGHKLYIVANLDWTKSLLDQKENNEENKMKGN